MQLFFYCTPRDLQEIFTEIELTHPLVYEPRYGDAPRIPEIDLPLRKPLCSCREFYEFGRACCDTPPFFIDSPEDESGLISHSNLLDFSGPPSSLLDSHVLCEGSLFLEPENRDEKPRTLYKSIRKIFTRRFVKSGYCFISPCVYAHRKEYLFIQRDHHFLAPAWYFDDTDQHTPIDIDSWYQMQGKRREQYEMPGREFLFFSAQEDLKGILSQLEEQYDLKYVEAVRLGKGSYRETVFDTAGAFMSADPYHSKRRNVYLYDQTYRMLVYLEIDPSWDRDRKIAAAGKALEIQNAFGAGLYHDFLANVKGQFQKIREPHYGPFYISPLLYTHRHDIVLSLSDPYFRVNENDEAVHIWRREWNELPAQWNSDNE